MPRPDFPLRRHQLVRVRPKAWAAVLASRLDLNREPLLRDWASHGWPLIVRRPIPGEAAGLPLGLPLPPAAGKRRIAVLLQPTDVLSVASLPTPYDVMHTAPPAWQPCLRELDTLAETYDVQAGVFGSLAWQWLTGLEYLSASSDMDIVWSLPRRAWMDAFLADLAAVESRAPMRLDGELVRTDGAGVNWRELRDGHTDVALKTANNVVMYARKDFVGAAL
jgi:phosphoribosyl-dephospho-CoA transferase